MEVKKAGTKEYKEFKNYCERVRKRNRVKADVGWDWKKGWLCLVKASEIIFDIAKVNVTVETMSIGLD